MADRLALEESVHNHRDRLDNQKSQMDQQRNRLDHQRDRVDRYSKQNERLRDQLDRQRATIDRLSTAVADLRSRIAPYEKDQRIRELDSQRALQQLGALETRLGRLEEKLEPNHLSDDDESLAQARSLVDTVRREHDQVRVRFQVISAYEERMRRLEAAVIEMYDGDIRHPL